MTLTKLKGRARSDKVFVTFAEAVADVQDGATVIIGHFGGPGGMPMLLLRALKDHGARDLTIVGNTAGIGVVFGASKDALRIDPGVLVANGQVSKAIVSYPIAPGAPQPNPLEEGFRAGTIQIEMNPQGILAERDKGRRSGNRGILVAGRGWDSGVGGQRRPVLLTVKSTSLNTLSRVISLSFGPTKPTRRGISCTGVTCDTLT